MTHATSYFVRTGPNTFTPTELVAGAWQEDEQHIAPGIGLLAHAIETDHAARGGTFTLARLSYDILGVLPLEEVEVALRVLRSGRSIELIEGTLSHAGRPALNVRAWLLKTTDTSDIAGGGHDPLPPRESMPEWRPGESWPGGFVSSVDAHQSQEAPGRARSWARVKYDLIEGEDVSVTSRVIGTIDLANGTTPRVDPRRVAFPNLDLTLSLFRAPVSTWVGFDTTVTFGAHGIGLTHTILHDEEGPIGAITQSLTLRKLAP